MQDKWLNYRNLPNIALGSSNIGGFNAKLELWQSIKFPLALKDIVLSCWGSEPKHMLQSLNKGPSPLPFYAKLEDSSIAKLNFFSPQYIKISGYLNNEEIASILVEC